MDDMKNNQTKLCYIKNKNKLTGIFLGPSKGTDPIFFFL